MKILILILILSTLIGCGRGIDFSDGFRVGTVTKFSKRGVFCKTWEGKLNITTKQGFVAETVNFSVDKHEFIEVLTKVAENGNRIKLTYYEGFLTGPCYSSYSRFVENVEILK